MKGLKFRVLTLALCLTATAAACGSEVSNPSDEMDGGKVEVEGAMPETDSGEAEAQPPAEAELPTLRVSAIPDQDPDILNRLYGDLADYLAAELEIPVEYVPVIDYTAAVTAFKVGDLDLVWFGGLTGVQARLQVPGAQAIAQRDIDATFESVFIAGQDVDIEPFDEVAGLTALAGHSFSFGSESSTSGRLMPQYFMQEAGLSMDDLQGEPGFSGSHDNTITVVASGSYEVGALNSQVWESRSEAGEPDTEQVKVIFTTPPYFDYHWLLHPDTLDRYGEDFPARVLAAFEGLDGSSEVETRILDAFKATAFVPTRNENYAAIERVGRDIGLITD